MKKTVDVSLANDENSHNNNNSGKKQQKDNCEDSNEILEEIELNNIADDNKDADNAILDYKNSDLMKEAEKNEKFDKGEKSAQKNQVSVDDGLNKKGLEEKSLSPKVQEIESITIEIRSKNRGENDEKQSRPNSFIMSPPSVSSNEEEFNSKMLRFAEFNTKFCVLPEDETLIQTVPPATKSLNNPMKFNIPTKIEPLRPPTDTVPQISGESKENTSRLKNNSFNESVEKNNCGVEAKITTIEKNNTTAVTFSKKTFFESILNQNNQQLSPTNILPEANDYFVEKRYCTKCNLEQPLRCKHCTFCERCVGTYDHHCAWIGSCIGEKNKLLFFCFCFFQLAEICWVMAKLFSSMHSSMEAENWGTSNWGNVLSTILLTFFLLMTLNLVIYHSYLIYHNLTTCVIPAFLYFLSCFSEGEHLSWKKITYLKEIPRNFGSPFDLGFCQNLSLMIRGLYNSQPFDWKFSRFPGVKQDH